MTQILKYILGVLILIFSFSVAAQMSGSFRLSYIDGHTNTCIKSQSSSQINSGVSNKAIRSYCRCSAIYIADMLNNRLATEIFEGRQKFQPAWNEMAANYCRINLNNY